MYNLCGLTNCPYVTRVYAHCLHHELSSNGKSFTVSSMGVEDNDGYCLPVLKIVRKQEPVSQVVVAGFEDRLVCQEEEEIGMVSALEPKLHFLEETDEGVLSNRILSLSRSNEVRSALELFISMGASSLHPTPHACNSLLSCLLRNGFFTDALKIFMEMKREMTSGHTYTLMLKAIASTRGCDSALKMFLELERRGDGLGNVFDAITYNTLISICVKAYNWVQAERFWNALKENGHSATSVTYSLLVSVFVRCCQTELAYDAYSEMIHNGLDPSGDMMQAIISVCTKEGKWDLAYGVFQNMLRSDFIPNVMTYNALINSLGKAGEVELTFKVFALMKSSGHTPDTYTWNALLGALNSANRCMDALRLFESLQRKKGMVMNLHIYNTALFSCQKHALWERALQIVWQMEESDIPVSTDSYNLVISSCEVARKPKVALQVYEQMIHKKCIPNTFTYLSLIRACVWGSLWSEVQEILDHVPPDVSLYNAAIHGMCLQGEISSAKKIYTKMSENGLTPDGKTRALMLQNQRKESIKQNYRHRPHRQRR